MKKMKVLLALLLAALLLTGCAGLGSMLSGTQMIKYEDMEYVRPDMGAPQNRQLQFFDFRALRQVSAHFLLPHSAQPRQTRRSLVHP